jgi:hypothetical protein
VYYIMMSGASEWEDDMSMYVWCSWCLGAFWMERGAFGTVGRGSFVMMIVLNAAANFVSTCCSPSCTRGVALHHH